MKDRIKTAFDDIHADEALLQKTAAYLQREREKGTKKKRSVRPLRVAAAILVFFVGVFGYQTYYASAASYVSIDANPSIELTLNRFDRVIDTFAYNAEGEELLAEVSQKGKRYDEAAASLITAMEQKGYFKEDAFVLVTVQTADGKKEQLMCEALRQSVNGQFDAVRTSADVEVFPVTRDVRESASGCHMSAAKYLAIQELMEVDQTATLDEYGGHTIHSIKQRTQQCRQGEEHNGAGQGNQSGGNGHHSGQEQPPGQGHRQGAGHGGMGDW